MAQVISINGQSWCHGAPECNPHSPVDETGGKPPGVVGGLPPAVFPAIFSSPPSQADTSGTSPLSAAIGGVLAQLQPYLGIVVLAVVGYLLYRWWRKRK